MYGLAIPVRFDGAQRTSLDGFNGGAHNPTAQMREVDTPLTRIENRAGVGCPVFCLLCERRLSPLLTVYGQVRVLVLRPAEVVRIFPLA